MRMTLLNQLERGEATVAYFMLQALVPLLVVVVIAVAFDRWNSGRGAKRRSHGADRRKWIRL